MWEKFMDSALANMTMARAERHHDTGIGGIILAAMGGVGWASTQHVVWLFPIGLAIWAAIWNARYVPRLARAKAQFDFRIYKIEQARQHGFDLKVIEPITPDPDEEI